MALLSNSDRKKLENNPYVLKVTNSNVTYKVSFKIKAVKLISKGHSPRRIFEDAGIDLALFGQDYAKKCIQRWRKALEKNGQAGLNEERRGKASTGRPKGRKFNSLEEENAYLRAENDFLKKLRALEEKSLKKKSSF